MNAQNWGIEIHENSYMEIFEKEKLVYLTADAEEEIDEFELR